MIEPQATGFVRAKMSVRTAKRGMSASVKQRAIQARRRLYKATGEIDAIIRSHGEPDSLEAALRPFLDAAAILPVSPDDGK